MVKVNGEDGIGEHLVRAADEAFEHQFVSIGTGTLADLDDEWCLAVNISAEQAHGLFEVVDVIGADGIFAVCCFK